MVLNIAKIRIDGGTQSREALSDGTVAEYAEAMRDGAEFPPVVVYHDGSDYWMADGFHRLLSAKAAGLDEIAAEVLQGTKRDAILHSVGSNFDHGLPRTNADKRRAVTMVLEIDREEGRNWSDRDVGRRCHVHGTFVGKVRREFSLLSDSSEPAPALTKAQEKRILYALEQLECGLITRVTANNRIAKIDPNWAARGDKRTYITKHGTTSTMRTENIGRRSVDAVAHERVDAPSPETQGPRVHAVSRGVALKYAHQAINALGMIPPNDGLRDEALDTVARWIEDNR